MWRSTIFSLLIFFQIGRCFSQEGEYFLTHHKYGHNKFNNENFDIEEDKRGFLYFANKNGVIQYDGYNWELISCPGSVYDLHITSKNRVYIAGKMGFGYLQYTHGITNAQYISLSDSLPRQAVCKISQKNDSLFFLSEQKLFIYTESQNAVHSISPPDKTLFQHIFLLDSKMCVQIHTGEIFFICNGVLIPLIINGLPENAGVVFSISHPSDSASRLIGTNTNELFLYENGKATHIPLADEDYITHSGINSCQWVDDDLAALGTCRGGVIFFRISTGKVKKIVNYRTGLPDNEVHALGRDKDQGIWVAHEYGFTRIAPNLPFRNYSSFPGIEGQLLSVIPYENTIYVGTSTGLYYLETVKDYREIVHFVRGEKESAELNARKDNLPQKKEKRGGVSSFFRSKKKEQEGSSEGNGEAGSEKNGFIKNIFSRKHEAERRDSYTIHKERELKSVRYVYKAVEESPGKSPDIKRCRNSLIAGGAAGLFEVKNGQAFSIDSDNTTAFFSDVASNEVFSFTIHQMLKVFIKDDRESAWRQLTSLYINDNIVHINPVSPNEVWLSGKNAVYQLIGDSIDGYELTLSLPIENPYNDKICSFWRNGIVYFVTTNGYFHFDPLNDTLIRDENLDKKYGKTERVIVDHTNVWVFNGKKWVSPSNGGTEYPGLNILGFFKHIKSLYTNENKEQFWVITTTNELFKISPSEYGFFNPHYKIFLKEVRNKDGISLPVNNLRINQDESFLTFEFVHPDYTGLMDIEYQYKLVGLSDQWTEWTKTPILSHQFLPPGSYELVVRIRNALGEVSEENILHFRVEPHYWKTWWFYLLEIVFFSSLLWITYLFNRHEHKYVFVPRLLTLFTLILVIEFVQILAESYWGNGKSPVISFFLQAGIAFIISPVERKLRGFLSGKVMILK